MDIAAAAQLVIEHKTTTLTINLKEKTESENEKREEISFHEFQFRHSRWRCMLQTTFIVSE